MKKYILILFLTFCQCTFCQEYSFDSYYFYNCKEGDRFFLINSKNDSYFILGYGTNDLMYCNIIDLNNKIAHHMNVVNSDSGLEFNYLYSVNKFNRPTENSNIVYDSSTVHLDSLQTINIFNKYKVSSRGKKKYLGKVEIQFDNSDFVFHEYTFKLFIHHFFNLENGKLNSKNKLPLKFSVDYNDGKVINFNLTKKQKINALLTISDEQINFKK